MFCSILGALMPDGLDEWPDCKILSTVEYRECYLDEFLEAHVSWILFLNIQKQLLIAFNHIWQRSPRAQKGFFFWVKTSNFTYVSKSFRGWEGGRWIWRKIYFWKTRMKRERECSFAKCITLNPSFVEGATPWQTHSPNN